MTSLNPYKTDPYRRRLKKKVPDEEVTEATPDSENAETELTPTNTNKKPIPPSSFSADAIKRRLNKDKYGVN